VAWAWINFTWFASAYDTDDWPFRLTTMIQMVGVLVLALGLPDMFASVIDHDEHLDLRLMVVGYVVMRLPMVFQWIRAGRARRADPDRRALCANMAWTLVVAQVGWALVPVIRPSMELAVALVVVLVGIELAGPLMAEKLHGGSPWHGHHIAERYGPMVIIALGEGLLGTTAALGALTVEGWTVDAAILGLAGTALTFGVWWTYFVVPWGHLLSAYRSRSFGWGYGHIPMFGAIVAIGAGLHVAAYFLEHESELDATGTVLAVAVPVAAYAACLYLLYAQITRTLDPFRVLLIAGTAVLLLVPLLLSSAGVDLVWCLAVLALSPWVTVVGYELVGHRFNAEVLATIED
jgi:low temperature requirement protein LtrA